MPPGEPAAPGNASTTRRQVLILCTGNSARSQMAEGWLRHLAGDRLEVASAGSAPTRVHPAAIRVMAERGIDLSTHRSKHVDELRRRPFDVVLTVCDHAAARCPTFSGPAERLHWSLPDPAAASGTEEEIAAAFRDVRDTLERRLRSWLAESGLAHD